MAATASTCMGTEKKQSYKVQWTLYNPGNCGTYWFRQVAALQRYTVGGCTTTARRFAA